MSPSRSRCTCCGTAAPSAQQTIRLRAGDNPLLLQYAAARQGWNSFTATVTLPGDAEPANDSGSAVVDVERRRACSWPPTPGSPAAALFAGKHLQVTTIAPGSLPATAAAYHPYDAVVLDDVSAPSIGTARAAALDTAVRVAGWALLALGGPHSFSLGHYGIPRCSRCCR